MKKEILSVLMILTFFLFQGKAGAQEGINATAGLGFPEMLNLGLRLQFERTQLGVAVGIDPFSDDDNIALSGNYYYHFGTKSEISGFPPWYVRAGFTYLNYKNEWERNTSYMIGPGVGAEINITPKFGIAMEIGLSFVVHEEEKNNTERPDDFFGVDLDLLDFGFVLPAGGLNLFYRF